MRRALSGVASLARVLFAPVLIDGDGDARQLVAVFRQFENIGSRKKLDAVRRWIAQRF
jgi:hypothetical protein